MPAVNTLGTLKKNTKAKGKTLEKISSGMRINSAGDDASGLSISERMRAQIRGLDQDVCNTENGISMLKVAEGGVSSTVEILTTIKEKALDAANDTNTDKDRETIQKEIDQLVNQCDDNAYIEFNGMPVLDGSAQVPAQTVNEVIVDALSSEWIENSLEQIEYGYGLTFEDTDAYVREMDVNFVNQGGNALAYVESDSRAPITHLSLNINMDYYNNMDWEDVNGKINGSGRANYLDRTIVHEMTHAVMAANIKGFHSLYLYIKEGAAELIHGVDDARYTEMAGFTPATLDTALHDTATSAALGSGSTTPYAAGYVFLRYLGAQSPGEPRDALRRYMDSLNKTAESGIDAMNAAVSAASKGKFKTHDELVAAINRDFLAVTAQGGNAETFYKKYCDIDLKGGSPDADTGSLAGWDASGTERLNAEKTVTEAGSSKYWKPPLEKSSLINGLTVHWPEGTTGQIGTKILQTGTKANQGIKLHAFDMRTEAIGLRAADGTTISVRTRYDAYRTITRCDKALRRALDAQTTIGALMMRLEFTARNLVTASENVTASESTIRDTDMAAAMSEYAKESVLEQAAQTMLSKANDMGNNTLSTVNGESNGAPGSVNNGSAVSAAHTLTNNQNMLSKSLGMVSSGLRIRSAADGASEYAIGERMKIQVRGLEQDIRNVKNGGDLVKIAEGGIQNIVDNLRDMKRMALDAANDTNTDADRATIQKEFDERKNQINDIALETNYNGRLLLTGEYARYRRFNAINSTSLTASRTINSLTSAFSAGTNSTMGGGSITKTFNGVTVTSDKYFSGSSGPMEMKIDFSGATTPLGGTPNYPSDFHLQGFAILCGGCSQYVNIIFDANKSVSQSSYIMEPDPNNYQARQFTIGIRDVTDSSSLADALFEGIRNCTERLDSWKPYERNGNTYWTTCRQYCNDNGDDLLLDATHDFRIQKNSDGSYSFTKLDTLRVGFYDGAVGVVILDEEFEAEAVGKPLVIQQGTKANDALKIYINDMRVGAMQGLEQANVCTRESAVSAISTLDSALEYALDQQTEMGAYQQRLNAIHENLVINHEQTLSSQSTLLDADMAWAMMQFAKYNILAQSSQAMLAQANQDLSRLLQLFL